MTARETLLATVCCTLLALVAIALDLPRQGADDLMFSGAAFSVANGHGLQNPLLANQFGTADFLVYPPGFFGLLGLWLWITGISTGSVLLFHHLCYALAGVTLTIWLARRNLITRTRSLWPALFAAALLAGIGKMGIRPESTAFATLFLGLVLRDSSRPPVCFAGWLAIGGSILVSPHMLLFATGLVLAAQFLDAPHRRKPLEEWKLILSAATTLFLAFLWAIDGRLGEFLAALTEHASRTSMPILDAAHVFIDDVASNTGRAIALVTAGLTLTCAWAAVQRRRARAFFALLAIIVGTLAVNAILDVSRSELRIVALLLCSTAAAAWLLSFGRRSAWFAVALIAAAFLFDYRSGAGAFGDAGRPDPAQVQRIRALVAAEPDRRYLVDSFVARHVFDYRLPSNARDWTFGRPFSRMWPESLDELRPDETWIIANYNLRMIEPTTAPALEPIVTLFGRSLTRRPGDFDLVVLDGRSAAAISASNSQP